MEINEAPACDIDFFDDSSLADPVAAYHEMLKTGPVVRLPKNGLFAICGFEALTSSLRNHKVFRSGRGVSVNEEINEFLIGSTLNSDPPEHDQTRAITFGPLSPRALEEVKAKVEDQANYIADKVVALGEFDAVSELATYLPLTIVRDLVGLGGNGRENMLKWAGATFEMMGDPKERRGDALKNMGELRAFLENPEVLDGLNPEGWANRATRMALEAGMPPQKAVSLMRDYIAPSLDTTISAIGYGVMLFAKNPDQWEKLRADRSLIRNAVEEIVRLNTPIKMLSRFVEADVEVAEVLVPKGSRAMMMFGAANRDKSKFVNPDVFDIQRNTRGHVGFGHGVHACLGMHLARLEMSCLFNALADRVRRFEIVGEPVNAKVSTIHAIESMQVKAHV